MAIVRAVDDLTQMSGRWAMCATSLGYFDARPPVDAATLVYRPIGRGQVAFLVRFRIRGRIHRLRGRQSTGRSADGLFRFRGWGAWLRVARIRWDLALSDERDIAVGQNAGSLLSPPGYIVFARRGVAFADVRRRIEAHPRAFGITVSQLRRLVWRDESRVI